MIFETSRLILRELRRDDFADLYEILSDEETMKHYPHPFDEEKVRNWIEWNIDNYATYGFGLWAVILEASGEFIGDCGITMQNIRGNMEPEIGYHIKRKYQKQGYATEAAAACMKYAFKELNLSRVFSYMKYTNEASARTAMKNGMQFIEEYEDSVNTITKVYAINCEEWERQ